MVYWNNLIRGSTPKQWYDLYTYIYNVFIYIIILYVLNHGTPAMINSLMVSPRGRGFVSGRCGWDQGEGHPGQNGVWLFAEHESLEFDVARLKASENPGEDRKLRKENRNLINSVATMSLKYMMKGTTNNFMEICVKMSYSIDFNSWSTIIYIIIYIYTYYIICELIICPMSLMISRHSLVGNIKLYPIYIYNIYIYIVDVTIWFGYWETVKNATLAQLPQPACLLPLSPRGVAKGMRRSKRSRNSSRRRKRTNMDQL